MPSDGGLGTQLADEGGGPVELLTLRVHQLESSLKKAQTEFLSLR